MRWDVFVEFLHDARAGEFWLCSSSISLPGNKPVGLKLPLTPAPESIGTEVLLNSLGDTYDPSPWTWEEGP